ncbi:MAG: hypothetical protein ACFFCS_27930, partial [Candidatus Hodarchaeota archaeon]
IIAADPPPGNMTHVDVTLRLSVDLDRFKFPVDKHGEMLYDPLHCLDEAIMDGLFKNLDPSSMDYIDPDRAIGIEGWSTGYQDEFKRVLGMEREQEKGEPREREEKLVKFSVMLLALFMVVQFIMVTSCI